MATRLPHLKIDTTTVQALQSAAGRPFYATVGVTDLAVGAVRDYVGVVQSRVVGVRADVQKNVASLDLQPKALRDTAVSVVTSSVDALNKEAQARRAALEMRVAALQSDARTVPARVQSLVDDNVTLVEGAYGELVKRGEGLVGRIRRQRSTQETLTSADTTVAKAKGTKTQTVKAAKTASNTTTSTAKSTAKTAAKKAASGAKKRSAAPRGSAKATTTAAKKTASSSTKAVADAAKKVGD